MYSTTNIKSNINKRGGLLGIIIISLAIIIIIFYVYSTFVGYFRYHKTSPYLIHGMIDATTPKRFKSFRIEPSASSAYGTEFSYSTWLFIDDKNFSSANSSKCNEDSLIHIFHKGSYDYFTSDSSNTPVYYPLLEMPGVWLYPNTNKLNIRFNTYENVVETSDVGNIPLNMWVNLIIVLIGGSVDIYINGNLKKRTKLTGVPKLNYGDLYVTNWGGYIGYLSNLRYFNYAIQQFTIDQIFRLGPNLNIDSEDSRLLTTTANLAPNYWMTTGFPNSFGAPGYKQNIR